MSESENKPEEGQKVPARPAASAPMSPVAPPTEEELDPAGKALADALRISFGVLKIVMLAVLGLFIWSGVYKVEANEEAIELRFGRVKGVGEEAIVETGLHWKWPAPVEEVIKVPAKLERMLNINSFWHNKEKDDLQMLSTFRIGVDGYNVTASTSAAGALPAPAVPGGEALPPAAGQAVTDYNLMHTNWRLRYTIGDPIKFVERLWDGTAGTPGRRDGWAGVDDFLQSIVSDAVVVTSANWDIERILWYDIPGYKHAVLTRVKERIKQLDVGVEIKDLELLDKAPPRQVNDAFELVTQARLAKSELENQARGEANVTISRAQAEANNIKDKARAYRKMVVASAQADSDYFSKVLSGIEETVIREVPEGTADYELKRQAKYNELMEIYVDQLYQEMLRAVIDKAELVYVADPAEEMRIYVNRDTKLKPPGQADQGKDSKKEIDSLLRLRGIRAP